MYEAPLDQLLRKAIESRSELDAFVTEFMKTDVFVLGTMDSKYGSPETTDPGVKLTLFPTRMGPMTLAAFTSPETLATVDPEEHPYLSVRGEHLLADVHPNLLHLNPGCRNTVLFSSQDCRKMLDGVRPSVPNPRVSVRDIERHWDWQLKTPPPNTEKLQSVIKLFCSRFEEIEEAYLSIMTNRKTGGEIMLIGLRCNSETRDSKIFDAIAGKALRALSFHLAIGEAFEILRIDPRQDSFSGFYMYQSKCLYRKRKAKRFFGLF